VVSSNISNALTPGYGRRILGLSSATQGASGGVRIDGIIRIVDASLAADKRLAGAEQMNAQGAADFFARTEKLLGTPDDPSSISGRLAGLERALITAASRPDAAERLDMAVSEAQGLTDSLRRASAGIQEARSVADRTISEQVDRLNVSLEQVVSLNSQITTAQAQGRDISGLQDQRQRLVDGISELVPVREVPRDNGQIALFTTGGAVLLDGTSAEIGFDRSNIVTPYMSVEMGTLSGLTLNGTSLRTGSENGPLRGGSIGAQFMIRDELGVNAQDQIDAIARDLVSRFQDPAVDPSLAATDPGLFTDNGGVFDPVNERGLSSRLELNAAVDPDQGGASWRLRDGLNATVAGNVGNANLLQNLSGVLNDARVPGSSGFSGGAFTLPSLVSAVTSSIGTSRTIAEQELSFASARYTELAERQFADGVDTDEEIQRLLMIEQSYAANARMIEAVDEMMQTILRL
jgi:flagellar hook-associated protein 1 FlgK